MGSSIIFVLLVALAIGLWRAVASWRDMTYGPIYYFHVYSPHGMEWCAHRGRFSSDQEALDFAYRFFYRVHSAVLEPSKCDITVYSELRRQPSLEPSP